jgi:hypothetical protein
MGIARDGDGVSFVLFGIELINANEHESDEDFPAK